VGDVSFIAFEVERSSADEGKVFIHILGRKYGNDKFNYELLDLCRGFDWEVTVQREYPALLHLSSTEILALRECVLADYEGLECDRYRGLGISDAAVDEIFFYSATYMLDGYGLALVQDTKKEKLHFYDDEGGSGSLLLERGFFYGLIVELVGCIRGEV
jgi:hypothetical protein